MSVTSCACRRLIQDVRLRSLLLYMRLIITLYIGKASSMVSALESDDSLVNKA